MKAFPELQPWLLNDGAWLKWVSASGKAPCQKNKEEPGSLEQLLDKSCFPYIQITLVLKEVEQMLAQSQSMKKSLCPAQMCYLILLLRMNEVGFD